MDQVEVGRAEAGDPDLDRSTYRALPNNDTLRLFRLDRYDQEEGFAGHVATFDLDACPPYAALSYTWGPASMDDLEDDNKTVPYPAILRVMEREPTANLNADPEDVSIESQAAQHSSRHVRIEVSRTLSDFFLQLIASRADPDHAQELDLYLWVDSVCVNQGDGVEKLSQISIMNKIFGAAENVFIWLGKYEPYFEHFKWVHSIFIPAVHKFLTDQTESAECLSQMQECSIVDGSSMEQIFGLPAGSQEDWVGLWEQLASFLRNKRWFQRAWAMQEYVLATQPIFLCGAESVSTPVQPMGPLAIQILATRLFSYTSASAKCAGTDLYVRMVDARTHLLESKYRYGLGEPDRDRIQMDVTAVSDMLVSFRLRKSTYTADKVYSLLGVAKALVPPRAYLFTPSPFETAAETYVWITTALMRHGPGVNMLVFPQNRKAPLLEGLPSWVPDYSQPLEREYSIEGNIGSNPFFNVTGAIFPEEPRMTIDGHNLTVSAQSIGTVVSMFEIRFDSVDSLVNLCKRVILEIGETYAPMQQSTIGAIFSAYAYPSSITYYKAPYRPWSKTRQFFFTNDEELSAFCRKVDSEIPVSETELDTGLLTYICSELSSSLPVRWLLWTTSGYLCCPSEEMKLNDSIYVLDQCKVPLMLRETAEPDTFNLVGDVYVHGIMMGEIVNEEFAQNYRPITLV